MDPLPGRDTLLPFIGTSEFAQRIFNGVKDEGYFVLPGVLSGEEADAEYERMWDWVGTTSHVVRRHDPQTWQARSGADPWPCSQRDMMQLHQAGWVFSDLREKLAERVFEKLYGTRELHCSKDGFTLQRPTLCEMNVSPNDHYDQGPSAGLQCIQGSVALTDQEHDDGCFLCWPRSHEHREAIMSQRQTWPLKDFVMLSAAERKYLVSQGMQPRRVPVRKGDVVLWRSDLVHKGAPPIGVRSTFRAVVYVCMLPAALTPEAVYGKKWEAFQRLETGNHWPQREEWFKRRGEVPFDLRPYFRQLPVLTARQRLLYGLDRYAESNLGVPSAMGSVESNPTFTVVRLAVRPRDERPNEKWCCPKRNAVSELRFETDGPHGDYNHYRQTAKKGTKDRAVSLMTTETLLSLSNNGYALEAGDMGENITLDGPEGALAPGVRLCAADLELEITERMIPCKNLEHVAAVAALATPQQRAFPKACKNRRGWYARVLTPGQLSVGSSLTSRHDGAPPPEDGAKPKRARWRPKQP
uniref:MOSC domain-containing protein n=1 Tax=Noctiluca scintillans TaxID=2966 RepID=A0A7S1FCU1_NOCSC